MWTLKGFTEKAPLEPCYPCRVILQPKRCTSESETREKAVAKKIESVQKRIDALPTLQKKLEDLSETAEKFKNRKPVKSRRLRS